jgi:hypothetical protein
MGIRQQVKTGALTVIGALEQVDPKGKCAAWLGRRLRKELRKAGAK